MQKPKRGKTIRTPAKKKAAKKAAVKKPVPKKAAKKTPAKKSTKKVVKKSATKKSAAKKPVAKKSTTRTTLKKKSARKAAALPPPRRPKSFATGEIARGYGFAEGAPELPKTYGEDRLTLMVKDPEYLFAYWEITPERLAQAARTKRADGEYREAMRLNWEARGLFEPNYVLLPVTFSARRWYLRAPHSGLSYRLELGWLGSQGHFISLLDSNLSDAPESWSATRRRLKRSGLVSRGGVLEYNLEATRPLGASETGFRGVPASSAPETPDFGAPGSLGSSFGSGPRA